jgi:6-phosphofructokinase 2
MSVYTVTLNPSLDEWIDVDALRVGELNRARAFSRYVGGKGINVSRVVHELGGRTLALSFAGGPDGHIFRLQLEELGLPHRLIAVDGLTRNNYKIRSARPKGLTEINAPGPAVTRGDLRAMERLLSQRSPRPSAAVFSGSVPPGAPDGVYAGWIRAARARGLWTALDASGAALRAGLRGRPWLTKPNRHEAEELLGGRLSTTARVIDGARAIGRLGASLVVISLGADGAVLVEARSGEVWLAAAPRVRVVSAVGAGDSLVAGFVVGWLRSRSLTEAFRLGVACGTATALTPGTELCHRTDVRRLVGRVKLRRAG